MKVCTKCKVEKELSKFSKRKDSKDGLRGQCNSCLNPTKKKWRDNNKEYHKEYREGYKEKRNLKNKERLMNDALFRCKSNITSLIKISIKNKLKRKKQTDSKSIEILGCNYDEFKSYIESKFEDWMNWDNYGLYNGEFNYGWDFDHIIPMSSAKTEEEVIQLNHYTNFQPLCSKTNRDIKRNH